jgi:hypothetical protein
MSSFDFRLNDNGEPLCLIEHVTWDYSNDELKSFAKVPTRRLCGEVFRLKAVLQFGIGPQAGCRDVDVRQGNFADAYGWTVECDAGHVLATSNDDNGTECAEPFHWDVVFGNAVETQYR